MSYKALLPRVEPKAPLAIRDLIPRAEQYASEAKSSETRRAYSGAWRRFTAWCASTGLQPMPCAPETLALYITHLADTGKSCSTVDKAVQGIAHAHHLADVPSPHKCARVDQTMAGIRRAIGVAPHCKAPLLADALKLMCRSVPASTIHVRDRALLLLGWSGAFRRSELVALNVGDLKFTDEGVEVRIRRSKTDQVGRGRTVAIPLGRTTHVCAVAAVQTWLDLAGIASGAVLRSVTRHGVVGGRLTGRSVALIVKKAVAGLGLDPKVYAGHSLRAGLVTSAAQAGRSDHSIMQITGHASVAMLHRYVRNANLFKDAANRGLL